MSQGNQWRSTRYTLLNALKFKLPKYSCCEKANNIALKGIGSNDVNYILEEEPLLDLIGSEVSAEKHGKDRIKESLRE